MNWRDFTFCDEQLRALPSGALYWAREGMLVVSDLHLGKSERIARRGGSLLPPYETTETLTRLAADIERSDPAEVVCLGDSFDDREAAEALSDAHRDTIRGLQAGRRWTWVEGNHDPGPVDFSGAHVQEFARRKLIFRHVAARGVASGEISGHYHPKARIKAGSRPCFLTDGARLILPAYGCYTGGLDWTTPVLRNLFDRRATAFLTGRRVLAVPVPHAA